MKLTGFSNLHIKCDILRLSRRYCTGINKWQENISLGIKHDIEKYWSQKCTKLEFQENNTNQPKYYVLSMFPYPSGQLHMGHVRVYTISDTIARFHKMNGKNVIHPMGWDAFGLPAENAAIERNIAPDKWTQQNIHQMKEQLKQLGCAFDWPREFATCDSNYYKWTQFLFLKLYEKGLIYQKEASVNWDPVDQTVLADEQVDNKGCSWRSGAKVEKRFLKQWFVRTTQFAKALYDGLDDPILHDWRDIIKLQKHWLGKCNGVMFNFKINSKNEFIDLWTPFPEYITSAKFVTVSKNSFIAQKYVDEINSETGLLKMKVENPLTGDLLPVFVTDELTQENGESHLGIPCCSEEDTNFAIEKNIEALISESKLHNETDILQAQYENCMKAKLLSAGGFWTSSKLKDWLISRQRYWGTPIPIVHCDNCKVVPVPWSELPVELPKISKLSNKKISHLLDANEWLNTTCPKCKGPAKRETDTMDTFVDSSWYYLRFIDPHNNALPFSSEKVNAVAPVDIYIGGKEHAVLHLYYARFISHFLHSIGLISEREPFKRLLVQGMVMGQSYRLKSTGMYLPKDQVEIINLKKGKVVQKHTKEPVIVAWEKMSKSKYNGVDPMSMFEEYGTDTTRLLILADVAPMSHRNWTTATFPGILKWQHRLWLTMSDFIKYRTNLPEVDYDSKSFKEQETFLFDSRNYYVKGVTFNYAVTHQLSVAISKMQGLTNSLRKSTPDVIAHGRNYERALAAQIIMLAPMAPSFASELWAGFKSVANELVNENEIKWADNVIDQSWPDVDSNYKCTVTFKVNGTENSNCKLPRKELDDLTQLSAFDLAMTQPEIKEFIGDRKILNTSFLLYKGCTAELNITTERKQKQIESDEQVESFA